MTAYETLQQAVADTLKSLNDAKTLLRSLTGDNDYIKFSGILADPRVAANIDGWISYDGTYWRGSDARSAHANAQNYVSDKARAIDATSATIPDLQSAYDAARKNLVDYEKNSPIGQQTALNLKDSASKKSLIVTVVVIGIVIVVVAGVIYFLRKKKKGTVTATA